MSLDGTAVREIIEGARPNAEIIEIDGVAFATQPVHDVRGKDPEPDTLLVSTLTGLVDYIETNVDGLEAGKLLVQVVGPQKVIVKTAIREGRFQQRFAYLVAEQDDILAGFFGRFHALEEFNIALQSRFLETDVRRELLRIVGNIKEESVKTAKDDGTTQLVTASAGVATVEEVELPNPVRLKPYRTFREIDQPESPFVLRLRPGNGLPEAALFEADGGSWKNDAVAGVANFLGKNIGEVSIIA